MQIRVPEVPVGHRVRVTVEEVNAQEPVGERVFGRLQGKIEILPGFDDPIPGMEWAYE